MASGYETRETDAPHLRTIEPEHRSSTGSAPALGCRFPRPRGKPVWHEIVRTFQDVCAEPAAGCEDASSHSRGRVCSPDFPRSAGFQACCINRCESSCPLRRGHRFPATQRRCPRGRWSRGLISPRLASHGRTPAGFTVNSRGWREGRATPPDTRRTAREPRRGSPGATPSTARGMGPPRRGGRHCGHQFRGCARASRTPGYSGTTPPGLSGRIPAPTFAATDTVIPHNPFLP